MPTQRLRELKGIGEKTEQLFARLGVSSMDDLVQYYPRDYELYEDPADVDAVMPGERCTILARIERAPSVRTFGRNSITVLQVHGAEKTMQINWFHMPYLRGQLKPGMTKIFRGMVIQKQSRLIMEHPQVFDPETYEGLRGNLLPVYGLTAGLSNQMLRKTMRACLAARIPEPDDLPEALRARYQLWERNRALAEIHFPETRETLLEARSRLIFDEFFLFLLGIAQVRQELRSESGILCMKHAELTEQVIASLPYELTEGQREVWQEIERDLTGGTVMSRLIQGDVGSGKTILAFLSMLLAMENGMQSALMVPTEVLAGQHFQAMQLLLQQNGLDPAAAVLLTGSCTEKEKRQIYEQIATGRVKLIIGTHALFQERVSYHRLGLVITDEQHRFGVRQRSELGAKGSRPHVLVMSATPIPRTLALMLYGDLDISLLRELPARRAKIKNAIVDPSYRPAAYRFFRKEIEAGHQIYVICPMVSPNEDLPAENVTDYAGMLQKEMGSGIRVSPLHGQMKPAEKNRIMQEFAENRIQILVSTTVIEVGINVPNATVMMVENAERFGLAQLHQLRGRVGRGEAQSYCIFVQKGDGEAPERLKILQESNDGFRIAEEDLKLRGPGDLFGVRQSGLTFLELADIYRDQAILRMAQEAVQGLLAEDPLLDSQQNARLRRRMERYMRQQNDDISL